MEVAIAALSTHQHNWRAKNIAAAPQLLRPCRAPSSRTPASFEPCIPAHSESSRQRPTAGCRQEDDRQKRIQQREERGSGKEKRKGEDWTLDEDGRSWGDSDVGVGPPTWMVSTLNRPCALKYPVTRRISIGSRQPSGSPLQLNNLLS